MLPGPLSSLSPSPDRELVAVAGREVLKILKVDPVLQEVINLRAGLHINMNFACGDVKWAGAYAKGTIASATNNGSVIIWDVGRPSSQKLDRILSEHTRTVNRVGFHPSEPVQLISASQDGTMRLWDLRTKSIA